MMKRRTFLPPVESHDVEWRHDGVLHRVRLAPAGPRQMTDELVVFERQLDEGWERFEPDPMSEVFASAALVLSDEGWEAFLGQLPFVLQDFLRLFHFERLEALAVITQCPEMLNVLEESPALTLFLAAHVPLRGAAGPLWSEMRAIFERAGVYGLLEWLGLPAAPATLAYLGELPDPEIPRHRLAAVRAKLWDGIHPLAA